MKFTLETHPFGYIEPNLTEEAARAKALASLDDCGEEFNATLHSTEDLESGGIYRFDKGAPSSVVAWRLFEFRSTVEGFRWSLAATCHRA